MKFNIIKDSNMLNGSEDHIAEIVGENIIIAAGFSTGLQDWRVPMIYKKKISSDSTHGSGFIKNIFCYNLINKTWTNIGILPITPRQRAISTVLGDKVYMWGGFSYTPLSESEKEEYRRKNVSLPSKAKICSYSDGLGICYKDNELTYSNPPVLPYPLVSAGLVNYEKDRKLYFLNGSLYDTKSFNTFQKFNNIEIGRSFFSMSYDADNNIIPNSIEYINNFPGSPRHAATTHLIGDFIYIIGGSNTTCRINISKGYPEYTYHNIIDNWKYDISNNKWEKLNDLPMPVCNFGSLLYKNRYIILIGGIRYNTTFIDNEAIIATDNIMWNKQLPYNQISTLENKFIAAQYDKNINQNVTNDIIDPEQRMGGTKSVWPHAEALRPTYNGYFSNMIIIYDTYIDKYILSENKLPININNPKIVKYKDDIYIIGGEGNPILIDNVYYGNCLSLMLKLNITDDSITIDNIIKSKINKWLSVPPPRQYDYLDAIDERSEKFSLPFKTILGKTTTTMNMSLSQDQNRKHNISPSTETIPIVFSTKWQTMGTIKMPLSQDQNRKQNVSQSIGTIPPVLSTKWRNSPSHMQRRALDHRFPLSR